MKRTYPTLIKDLLDKVLLDDDNRTTVLEQRASYLWTEVVGPGVNRYTFRRYVDHGVLHVYISSAPLKNDLSFLRHKILNEINSRLNANILLDIIIH